MMGSSFTNYSEVVNWKSLTTQKFNYPENGAQRAKKSDERSGERESEKTSGAERGAGGRGAVSGLNLPLMAARRSSLLSSVRSVLRTLRY